MNSFFSVLLWFGTIYFIIDTWILISFWTVKEILVQFNILWFPFPLTGILYFKEHYEFVSSLPNFTFQLFNFVIFSGPLLLFMFGVWVIYGGSKVG